MYGEMPEPRNTNKSKTFHKSGVITVVTGVVIVLVVVLLGIRWKQFRETKGEAFVSWLA